MRFSHRRWTFARWIRLPRILMDVLPRPLLLSDKHWKTLEDERERLGMTWQEFMDYLARLAQEMRK